MADIENVRTPFECVGIGAANMMDKLRNEFGDARCNVKVMIIADVAYERDDGEQHNETSYWTNDTREWVVEGFLEEMSRRVAAKREVTEEETAEGDD